MNINLTLIVQMLVFIVLIWFTMKFVWPMILGPMEERSKKIAQGLAAADKGEQSLVHAKEQADVIIREARERASRSSCRCCGCRCSWWLDCSMRWR